MGRETPYLNRPWFIGQEPIDRATDDWSVHVRCDVCGRERTLGRISEIPMARRARTTGELLARLTCEGCGAHAAIVTVDYVGLRRD